MIFDWFRGIQDIQQLTEKKYDGDWMNLVRFWNEHNNGFRSWDNLISNSTAISSNYTLLTSDSILFVDATVAVTVTLPTASGFKGKMYFIVVTTGTKIVTIATTSSQTINRAANVFLPGQDFSLKVVSDGSNWFIV